MFCLYVIFCCLDHMTWIANSFAKYGSSIYSKTSFLNSGDKLKLTLKISVTNFCKFRYFADFDIKVVLLVQNSFDWIAFCWGYYCVFWTYIEPIFYLCHLLLITLVLLNWILCKVLVNMLCCPQNKDRDYFQAKEIKL